MKLKAYHIIHRAVEEGISYGMQRSHKHTDTPSKEHIQQEILRSVMNNMDEIIDFEDDPEIKVTPE
ncbi:MAG: hypothetical protein VXY59_02720 [Pseudomonadota bacterium]|jgi:hypothetical protein|nr:hypothetical protein [Pseudomonadota bacterium]MEC8518637.1 hypothetical protein [Pseudomonadota bacterium]